MGEVRLDAGKAPRFGPAARPTAGYDALLDTQHAISRCPSRSDARSWPGNRWNPGNVGLFVSRIDRQFQRLLHLYAKLCSVSFALGSKRI